MVKKDRRTFYALLIIGIISVSMIPVLYWFIVTPEIEITQVNCPTLIYKGESISIYLNIKIKGLPADILDYTLTIQNKDNLEFFKYHSIIEKHYSLGKFSLIINIPPIFEDIHSNKVVALSYGEYRLLKIDLKGKTGNALIFTSKDVNKEFSIIYAPFTNRIIHGNFKITDTINYWNISSKPVINPILFPEQGVLLRNTYNSPASVIISQKVNLTGVPTIRIIFEDENPNITAFFNDSSLSLINKTSNSIIYLASDKIGLGVLSFLINLNPHEYFILKEIKAITRHVSIFMAVLQYNWNNGTGFDPLLKDIKEASGRFLAALNISFVPGPAKFFQHENTTDLFKIKDEAIIKINSLYGLGHEWISARPYENKNNGFDLLFIATNYYTDHYGIVFSESYQPINIVVVSDQSKEAFGLKLKAEWVDNLFQHELSHVLWALDRWSKYDPPSVMTKPSNIQDAISMYMSHQLWLQLTNWLIEDQIRMLNYKQLFYSY